LCVSIMLIFNTSLSQALGVHKQVNGWMQTRMTKDASEKPVDLDEEDEEGEDDNLLIDDTDEMEDDEEEKIPEPKKSLFRASPLKEQPVAETVLTSKKPPQRHNQVTLNATKKSLSERFMSLASKLK